MLTFKQIIAEKYLDKARTEPWECSARDVRNLALMLYESEEKLKEAEKKSGELLTQSIDHSHAMLGQVLTLCLDRAARQSAET